MEIMAVFWWMHTHSRNERTSSRALHIRTLPFQWNALFTHTPIVVDIDVGNLSNDFDLICVNPILLLLSSTWCPTTTFRISNMRCNWIDAYSNWSLLKLELHLLMFQSEREIDTSSDMMTEDWNSWAFRNSSIGIAAAKRMGTLSNVTFSRFEHRQLNFNGKLIISSDSKHLFTPQYMKLINSQ